LRPAGRDVFSYDAPDHLQHVINQIVQVEIGRLDDLPPAECQQLPRSETSTLAIMNHGEPGTGRKSARTFTPR